MSEEEIFALQKIANTRIEEARRVQRANILLLAADGVTQTQIANAVGLSRPSVILYLRKYREAGWEYALADKIRIILDNHSIHTSKETRKYLETVPERFEFVFTPKHGSWLNLIESFFGKLARICLRGIRVKSKEELTERIYRYIAEVNEDPVVYRWTYKMDEFNVS